MLLELLSESICEREKQCEPLPEKHALRNMDNVVLTPHISGISWGKNLFTRKRIVEIFCDNLKRDILNETKKNIIDFDKGY